MSRSPLFRSLRRALTLVRWERSSGRAALELLEDWRQQRDRGLLTRRDLLQTGSLAAVGLGLGVGLGVVGCRRAAPHGANDPKVLIVGAGIAGLTAGYRLKQAGIAVEIIEAQSRTGGRMFSQRGHFADGQVAELGGELIDSGHFAIRGLAEELGIELDDLSIENPELETDWWHFDGRSIKSAEILEAYRPVADRIDADLSPITSEWPTFDDPGGAEQLDRTTLAEWLDSACGDTWFRRLLEVAYTTEYGLEADRQSALNLLFLIDSTPDAFHIFGDSDERFHVRGGNDQIPGALAERLVDEIETGLLLEAMKLRSDGSFNCSLRRGESSEMRNASHVVLALPFTLLRDVRLDVELPAVKQRAIAELGYGTNAKLMVGFSERVWRTRHGSNGSLMTDLGCQTTWEASRQQAGSAGILTNFTGGDHGVALGQGTAAEQAERLVANLEQVFPGVAAARDGMTESRFHWPSHPYTRGSYASYLPGQWTGFGGAEGTAVGRLHFIGEHTSQDAQGFMEGGCETGERAAREILEELGVASPVRRVAALRLSA